MRLGISDLSIIPVRVEPSEKAEMLSQILFGEKYEILETREKWAYIKMIFDGYTGWIDLKMLLELPDNMPDDTDNYMCVETFNLVNRADTWGNKLLVPGSNLPYFNNSSKEFKIADIDYILSERIPDINPNESERERLIGYALKYFNSPYLWGGRTPYGIDCSGLIQIVYKLINICLPRDASQQVSIGDTLLFVDEAQPGDLAFFGDEDGHITHVGMIWKHHKIIHASGRVRIDNIDQEGIYNEEMKRYTHKLRTIKRILK
jgi:hypothetical protein